MSLTLGGVPATPQQIEALRQALGVPANQDLAAFLATTGRLPVFVENGVLYDKNGQAIPVQAGLQGNVSNGLLIVQFEGQNFALVPVAANGAIEANLVPRTGTQAALATLSGEAGEVATITDGPGVMIFDGTPGGARGIYADNAGRTMVVTVAPEAYTGPTIDIGPDVTEVHVKYTTLPTPTLRDGVTIVPLRFTGQRRPGQRFRLFQECLINFLAGVDGGPNALFVNVEAGRRWTEFFLDTTGATPTYRPLFSGIVESDSGLNSIYQGSMALGDGAHAFAAKAVALGPKATANLAGEIAFGAPAYSDLRTNRIIRVGGVTTGVNGTAVLTPTGAAASESNMFGFDQAFGASAFGMRLDIMGKRSNSADCVRFVREIVVQRSSAGALTLVTPATPNNPSDILTGTMTGANVALSIASVGGGTNNALQILVTGPNTSMTTRWSCVAYTHAMGNG